MTLAVAAGLALSLWGCGGGGGGGGGGTGGPPPGPGNTLPAPQAVAATEDTEAVTVTWDNVTGAGSYNIYWLTAPGVSKTTGNLAAGVSSPHRLNGLSFGVTCYVVVTASADNGAESPESAVASAFVLRPSSAGRDMEQYFDGAYNQPNATSGRENYDDRSRHPLTIGTTAASLRFGGTNCLGCHGAKVKSGGAKRYSDECLKCHFENVAGTGDLDSSRHGNGAVELATITGNGAPAAQFTVSATDNSYDIWCLQCHDEEAPDITLGGISPSGRTLVKTAAVANGRHRAMLVGCIYCHQPHGRANTRIVRENPQNRRSAGAAPRMFGVYPNDTTGSFGYPQNQLLGYRARVDNNYADAADENEYCNVACHYARFDDLYRKDKMLLRDETTGNYVLSPTGHKIYLVNGVQYTNDNINNLMVRPHQHPNGDVIPTDNMVRYYAQAANVSGPTYYKYPGLGDANPASMGGPGSPLPFFPDFVDGSRDFTNAYSNLGTRIKYRFTCSTCHDPHGTTVPNGTKDPGYPDLRLPRDNSNSSLCIQCKR